LASIATDSVPLLGKKLIILGLKVVYLDMISLMLIKDQRPQGIKFILKFQRNRTIILRDNWNANEIHYIRHDSKSCSGPTKLKGSVILK
jgi:hypothetical protein